MLGWHGTVMMRVSRRKVLVRDDDTVLGTHKVAPQALIDTDDYLSGQFLQGRLATPEPRTDQLPAALAIVDFPA
jgi:hypothetical protein